MTIIFLYISDLVYHEYKPWDDPYNKTANLVGVSHVSIMLLFKSLTVMSQNRSEALVYYTIAISKCSFISVVVHALAKCRSVFKLHDDRQSFYAV
jgi:hypothetical protein